MSTTLQAAPARVAPRRSAPATGVWLVATLAVLVLAAATSVAFGARSVGWNDVVAALAGQEETVAQAAVASRIPRTVLAMVVGAALGMAGAVLQGLTRNPLADPAILGVTWGASLAVVTGIVFFGLSSATGYVWFAIVGSAGAAVLMHVIGSLGRGGATPLKLALAGAAITAAFSSLVSAILLPRLDVMDRFRFWQIGGVGGANTATTLQVLPFLLLGALLCLVTARGLNSLALGEDVAAGLGESVTRTRVLAGSGAVLLCGAATALAGPIGFVGLVVPHACRLLIGLDHRRLLPFSALTGAVLLTVSDVVGRVVARPSEIDVGIVTAVVGAPVFIAIVRRQKARAL
ncbi:FecCD family ABC transporter permease [Mobilicoccus caccae]|uniref:ABC transporter permease n=1 Tax=Mobilicoccus caccae TaxID=1859295 RepID=A0ABQ6IUN4_9MICO|nr:ABC transporter permease [Mobilicoccus caccae]